jgi:hypothetical protein
MRIAVVISVVEGGDRSCVEDCQRQCEALAASDGHAFETFINNDGAAGYLKQVEAAGIDGFDAFIWLDSDLRLEEGALESFLTNSMFLRHKALIVGTVSDGQGVLVSGGRSRHWRLLQPDPVIPVPCHLYDLAMVFAPKYAVRRLQTPADIFNYGIFEYGSGSRAAAAGVARVIAPGILARAASKAEVPQWKDNAHPLRSKVKAFWKSTNRDIIRILHSVFR